MKENVFTLDKLKKFRKDNATNNDWLINGLGEDLVLLFYYFLRIERNSMFEMKGRSIHNYFKEWKRSEYLNLKLDYSIGNIEGRKDCVGSNDPFCIRDFFVHLDTKSKNNINNSDVRRKLKNNSNSWPFRKYNYEYEPNKTTSLYVMSHEGINKLLSILGKHNVEYKSYEIDILKKDYEFYRSNINKSGSPISDLHYTINKDDIELSMNTENEHKNELFDLFNNDSRLSATERKQLTKLRTTQGKIRQLSLSKYTSGEFVNIKSHELLIASHIKPWSKCDNAEERNDVNNIILLDAMTDSLFDRGLITFGDNGGIILSNEIQNRLETDIELKQFLESGSRLSLNKKRKEYLRFHRHSIFKDKVFFKDS